MSRTASALLGSGSDARHAIQAVFLWACRNISKLVESRGLGPWLCEITANICRDIARGGRRYEGALIGERRLV